MVATKNPASKFKRKPKETRVKKAKLGPLIEKIYEEEIEFDDPVRGKIKQKVKIQRYKTPNEQANRQFMSSSNDLDGLDDGLDAYDTDLPAEDQLEETSEEKAPKDEDE